MAGKADKWVKQITFGRQVEFGDEDVSDYVEEVLSLLSGAKTERVAAVGVKVKLRTLTTLADLKNLHLDQAVLEAGATGTPRFNVTHLQLSNNRLDTAIGHGWFRLTSVQLPELVHLYSRNTDAFVASSRNSNRQAAAVTTERSLGKLEHVALDECYPFSIFELERQCTGLTSLHAVVCRNDVGPLGPALLMFLGRLPRSLATLDLTGLQLHVEAADRLRAMFTSEHASVSELKVLRLPRVERDTGLRELELVAATAKERGVKVEWVDSAAGRSR